MNTTATAAAFARLFTDSCDIYRYEAVRRADASTGSVLRSVYTAVPCRISFSNIKRVHQTETVGHAMQTVRLFLAADVEIEPGSVVCVHRAGRTMRYKNSGIPAVYETHQEVLLEPERTSA